MTSKANKRKRVREEDEQAPESSPATKKQKVNDTTSKGEKEENSSKDKQVGEKKGKEKDKPTEDMIKITIKKLDGTKCELSVPKNALVSKIKLQMEELEGIKAVQLRLIYRGALLQDIETLDQRNVKDGDLIHAALMLRGGYR